MTSKPRSSEDGGFAFPFVLLLTMLVLMGTATMLTVVANNIRPASNSQSGETALAGAQAGVQDYVAHLDSSCLTKSIQSCSYITQTAATPLTGTAGHEAYCVAPLNSSTYLANHGDLRIVATGLVNGTFKQTGAATDPTCTPVGGISKTLVADLSGKPSALRYAYFSDLESLASDFLTSYYTDRIIPIGSSGATASTVLGALNLPSSTSVHWHGLSSTGVAWCDSLFYGATGRYAQTGGTDTYTEARDAVSGLPTDAPAARTDTCDATFSNGMTFNGPIYSRDALLLSNGLASNPTGPAFTTPGFCSGAVVSNCETLYAAATAWDGVTPAGVASALGPFRTVPIVGGAPSPTNAVQHSPIDLQLPNTDSDVDQTTPTYTCAGPTTITLQATAVTMTGGCTVAGAPLPPTAVIHVTGATGDATISGSVSGTKLSVVADHDVIVTGDVTTDGTSRTNGYGEPEYAGGGAIDLVATHDVRIDHKVTCATGSATSGYCANDLTGLYTTAQSRDVESAKGSLLANHPARQYCNATGDKDCGTDVNDAIRAAACDSSSSTGRTIQAAVFALTGSVHTDNFNRGCAMGNLLVTGGVYEHHRGAIGIEWPVPNRTTVASRAFSGYKLQIHYVSLQLAGLPYVPPLQAGSPLSPWIVLSIATKATS